MGAAITAVYGYASSHQDAFIPADEWMHRLLIGQKGATIREITEKAPFFTGPTHFCTTNLGIWQFFGQETYIHFVAQETRIIWQLFIFNFFHQKRSKSTRQNRRFRPFSMKKLKHKKISDNAGFLGYKVNISFLTEKLPHCQICGTKVGPAYKKRRQSLGMIKFKLILKMIRESVALSWRELHPNSKLCEKSSNGELRKLNRPPIMLNSACRPRIIHTWSEKETVH